MIKVVLIGNSSVGKTAIFKRLSLNKFEKTTSTIGAACANISVPIDGKEIPIVLWDTAGQDSFKHIIPMYFNNASFILVVYDVTSESSFQSLPEWINLAYSRAPQDSTLILIGNKNDLEEDIRVAHDDALSFAEEKRISSVFEISAKTGANCDVLLEEIAVKALTIKKEDNSNAVNILEEQGKKKSCC